MFFSLSEGSFYSYAIGGLVLNSSSANVFALFIAKLGIVGRFSATSSGGPYVASQARYVMFFFVPFSGVASGASLR